ncbi:MAG: hypothetical protein ABW065_04215 [Solirubrobacterales bacterium]
MDASDDLRATFARRRAAEADAAREQDERDGRRHAFEEEEDRAKERLREVAEVLASALAATEPEDLLIMPRRPGLVGLFTTNQFARGWRLDLDMSYVLREDGTLVRPGFHTEYSGSYSPQTLTFDDWIGARLKSARLEHRESGTRNVFDEAFVNDYERSQQEMKRRLADAQQSITEMFADVLEERGISL